MRIVTYDFEVLAHDWIVVLKDKESGEYTVIHNNPDEFKACLNDDTLYFGFNSKHYDQYIAQAVANDFSPEQIKQVNDYLIGGGQGWQCPLLADTKSCRFANIDIRDDTQIHLSLKAIEGHLGMDIRESSVPFDLERPLTIGELNELIYYCKHDVDATERLIDVRRDYLKNKIQIGKMARISESRSLSMTNAKLTAALLQAERKDHDDERAYVIPDNLNLTYIPREVIDFFAEMKNPDISDDDLFSRKLSICIGDCPVTIGYGGIHGAINNLLWEEMQ